MKTRLLLATFFLLSASLSRAELLFYEGFDYTPGEARLGQVKEGPKGGQGWTSPWVNFVNSGFLAYRVSRVESAQPNPGFPFARSGGFLKSEFFEKNHWQHAFREMKPALQFDQDRTYYISLLVVSTSHAAGDASVYLASERKTGPVDSTNFLRFGLGSAQAFGKAKGRYAVRTQGDDGLKLLSPHNFTWEEGEAQLIVLKIVASATEPDTIAFTAFNQRRALPTQEPSKWDLEGKTHLDNSARWIRLSSAGAPGNPFHVVFDEVRIGTTWESVTPRR